MKRYVLKRVNEEPTGWYVREKDKSSASMTPDIDNAKVYTAEGLKELKRHWQGPVKFEQTWEVIEVSIVPKGEST